MNNEPTDAEVEAAFREVGGLRGWSDDEVREYLGHALTAALPLIRERIASDNCIGEGEEMSEACAQLVTRVGLAAPTGRASSLTYDPYFGHPCEATVTSGRPCRRLSRCRYEWPDDRSHYLCTAHGRGLAP